MRPLLPAAIALVVLGGCHPFRTQVPEVKDGIAAYQQAKFADAEKKFDQAIVHAPSAEAHFDDGAALARQHQLAQAADQFERTLASHDDALRARAYLNAGNARADGGQLDKAIEAYRRALEIAPTDADARYNLEWALRAKEAQKKQQQKKGGKSKPQAGNKGDKDQQQKKDDKGEQAKNDQNKSGQQGSSSQQNGQPKNQPSKGAGQQPGGQQQQAQAKQDQQQAQAKQDAQQAQAKQDAQQQQAQQDPQQQAQATAGQNGQQGTQVGQARQAKPMSRQDSAEVLDALQASEKNLQMWRFQTQHRRPKSGSGEDW